MGEEAGSEVGRSSRSESAEERAVRRAQVSSPCSQVLSAAPRGQPTPRGPSTSLSSSTITVLEATEAGRLLHLPPAWLPPAPPSLSQSWWGPIQPRPCQEEGASTVVTLPGHPALHVHPGLPIRTLNPIWPQSLKACKDLPIYTPPAPQPLTVLSAQGEDRALDSLAQPSYSLWLQRPTSYLLRWPHRRAGFLVPRGCGLYLTTI